MILRELKKSDKRRTQKLLTLLTQEKEDQLTVLTTYFFNHLIISLEEENQLDDIAKDLFKGRIPIDLRAKPTETKTSDDKTKKIAESDSKSTGANPIQAVPTVTETEDKRKIDSTTKDEGAPSHDINSSSMQESSEDYKRKEEKAAKKKELTERDLNKAIYITLSETNTTFMYFLPSQRYFHLRPGKKCLIINKMMEYKKRRKRKKLRRHIKISSRIRRLLLPEEFKL